MVSATFLCHSVSLSLCLAVSLSRWLAGSLSLARALTQSVFLGARCCPVIDSKQKLTGVQDFAVSMMPTVIASVVITATRLAESVLHSPVELMQ